MRAAIGLPVILSGCLVGSGTISGGDPMPDTQVTPPDSAPIGGTPGTLELAITTTTNNGPYSPLNCSVVWIESPGGTIVKTIDRKCGVRSQHLVAWGMKSGGSGADTDSVSGASRLNHTAPLSITWDLKDRLGGIVADGTYTIRMETTEANATTATQNHQGTFTFVKGAAVDARTGQMNNGFENVSITYTPP